MKKLIALFLLLAIPASAQSTATPVQVGFLSTSCSGLNNPCFVPYSASHPLPAYLPLGY